MSRPDNDPVARYIAAIVQHHLITSPAERPDRPPLPAGVTAVEAHAVGVLDTGICVTTTDRGNRYFLVRVTEFSTR
ncbi:MAG TPA: hypothetical protein VKG61_19810 [Streptosporangiaceae bacterium]|jgi:hypothetical protein|nr:hypothetical protein [Streptosporangiaceae bacterium]HME67143.1 hypothetical protein [Streptosporangiaceae bacterium]